MHRISNGASWARTALSLIFLAISLLLGLPTLAPEPATAQHSGSVDLPR
ncbi:MULTISPECIES: hypothetical protein [Pacificimonas]|uniref:Uncharacterized protein n=1 Tax=Pacificimonas aurantium TaxID=1250540 RepID=A0ABS7WI29_9SPHN|nr:MULTISPECIES: hypothetical protein [Pacificimonas]MBZ6377660.1 hypothetical protein [Pacificimonas aurantium]